MLVHVEFELRGLVADLQICQGTLVNLVGRQHLYLLFHYWRCVPGFYQGLLHVRARPVVLRC